MLNDFGEFLFNEKKQLVNLTYESLPWFLLSILKKYKKISYVCNTDEELYDLSQKLQILVPEIKVLIFPFFDMPIFSNISPSTANRSERINTISELANNEIDTAIVLTTIKSILFKIIPKDFLINRFIRIDINDQNNPEQIKEILNEFSYSRVDTVRQKGEFAIRGGIIDFFSASNSLPIRIDTFSSEIDTLKMFDPVSQLSTKDISNFSIIPSSEIILNKSSIKNFRVKFRTMNIKNKDEYYNNISNRNPIPGVEQFIPLLYENLENFLNYISNFKIILKSNFKEILKVQYENIIEKYEISEQLFKDNYHIFLSSISEIVDLTSDCILINEIINLTENKKNKTFSSSLKYNLKINNNEGEMKFLDFIKKKKKNKIQVAVKNKNSEVRINNLLKILNKYLIDNGKVKSKISIIRLSLKSGFECFFDNSENLIVITDEDLFGKKIYKNTSENIDAENLISEISTLNEGDLIVHIENGIGRYLGLRNIPLHKVVHECIEIEYYNNDKLLIPVENLDLITRYGNKDTGISLDKLGLKNWQFRKSNIKNKIKIIAKELIKIAAERKLKKGRLMIGDSDLNEKFSSKFEYAETSDQLKVISDIETDLASGKPMDRLICGDVGYGKTEMSMRASFIAVSSGFQVAFLCPTTLLVKQHYQNFVQRFKGFNVTIKKISRFESPLEKKKITDELFDNKIDILIGTHSILNDNIKFNNLGLLIIDEEQNFGVEQKEKLKKIKSDVHVLTLTATPIPRTLQSSMVGIKDLSLIKTPPVDRLAIKTYITNYNKNIIKNAIINETERGGQVFYVSPRIKDLVLIKKKLENILPDLNYKIVHGQLNSSELNSAYELFFNKKIDVLISTSIIESGLDISNANTIIVEKPNLFGLSQLYQIRGRVGRSNRQSYAYLIVPEKESLSSNAFKRLDVISNLDKLGGGFSIASHDMDIRGSGNILGAEQSGHIKEVGIELYQKLVKEAIDETLNNETVNTEWSPQINLGIPVFIPETYITNLGIRLNIYRRISNAISIDDINKILNELRDRFGKIPKELFNLTKLIEIKNLCKKANVNKIDLGSKGFIISFRNREINGINKLLNLVNKNSKILRFMPNEKILYINNKNKEEKINDVINFLNILSEMQNEKNK